MSGIVNDHRTKDLDNPATWIVATDKFMSGWGMAPNKSYVAYPAYTYQDRKALLAFCRARPDFIRVRENVNLPRVPDGCHLSIYDRPLETES